MKCIVINLNKGRRFFSAIKIIALALVLSTLAFTVAESVYFNSDYVHAMHAESEKMTVIIDAGHGGEDPGAVGASGVLEKDLNLQIALCLGELLCERGFAVIYTRTDDRLLYGENENIKGMRKISDLKNRCKIAAEYPNAIFISIHQNSYGSAKYSGLQVYHKPSDNDSMALASAIQNSVKSKLQKTNKRSIKSGERL